MLKSFLIDVLSPICTIITLFARSICTESMLRPKHHRILITKIMYTDMKEMCIFLFFYENI